MKFFSSIFFLLIFCSCLNKPVQVEKASNLFYKKAIQFRDSGKVDSAFLYFNKAKDSFLQHKDSLMVGKCLVNMAIISTEQGDSFGGQEISLNAIPYFDEHQKEHHAYILSNFNNLGIASYNLNQYAKAVEFYNQTLKFVTDSLNARLVKNNMANAYRREKDYRPALLIYADLLKKENNQINYARVLSNFALTKWLQNPKYNPVPEFHQALNIRKKENDVWGQNASYAYFIDYYLEKYPDSALHYAHKMYSVANLLNSPDDRLAALQKLVKLSDSKSTKNYFDIYQHLGDSLQNARSAAKNQFALIRYETEKHKADKLQLQKENTARKFGIISLLFLIVVGSIVTSILSKKRKERLQLENQNAIKESKLKISKKVHDVVANGLYRLMSEIENGEQIDQERFLDDMENLYEKSRDISYEDEIPAIVQKDFQHDIQQQLNAFKTEKTNVVILGNTDVLWIRVNEKVREELKHVLLELMVNMKKHSGASYVAFRFEQQENGIKIYYSDNGKGMPEKLNSGNGLRNTGNRMKGIGGSINFEKGVEGGLKIQLLFPFT